MQVVRAQAQHSMGFFDRLRSALARPHAAGEAISIRLVAASENPFGVELWDCRSFTQSMIAVTADQRIAETFTTLRSSVGAEYKGRDVPSSALLACHLEYPYSGAPQGGAVFKAAEMEDKWDIYLYLPHLYFARSWTGDLTYRAKLALDAGRLRITELQYPRQEDPEFARRVVDYLIKSHLLRALVPHPLPATLPQEAEKVALLSFSLFGRRCFYGSFADTTALRPTPPS